jgi:hypothetical protein
MGIATTYAQIPPLSELSGIPGMSGGPGYFDAAAGQPPLPTPQRGNPHRLPIRGDSRPPGTHKTTLVEGCPLQ